MTEWKYALLSTTDNDSDQGTHMLLDFHSTFLATLQLLIPSAGASTWLPALPLACQSTDLGSSPSMPAPWNPICLPTVQYN